MRIFKVTAIAISLVLIFCFCSLRPIDDPSAGTDTVPISAETEPLTSGVQAGETSEQTEIDPQTETDSPTETDPQTTDESIPTETDSRTEIQAPAGGYEPLVFMYHLILEEPYSQYDGLFVRPSEFRAQLEILTSLGYGFAFADEYKEVFDRPTAILTFDDGYVDNYTEMFPILREFGAKATVFTVTSYVNGGGYLTEDQIREMSASGLVSFQSHTVSHMDLSYLSADSIRDEMEMSAAFIESLTHRPVRAMAYPAGSFNDDVMAAVGDFVDFAYTTEPPSKRSVDSPLAIPRIRIPRGFSESAFRDICTY